MSKHKKHEHAEAPAPEVDSAHGVNGTAEAWTEEVPATTILEKTVVQLKEELDLANDKLLRLRAEFDNYRRRTMMDQQRMREQALDRAVLALLPALDDLERVRQTAGQDMDPEHLIKGVDMVLGKFAMQLEQLGITAFESRGQGFDPELHEALSVGQDPDAEDGHVLEVHVRGYQRGDAIIRHAQVIVNKR